MIIRGQSSQTLKTAISCFRKGFTIVYPTDTVYGLGTIASKENEANIHRIFKIKNRPLTKPLSLLMTKEMLTKHIEAPPELFVLLNKVWPAKVTIILNWKQSSQNTLSPLLNISKSKTLACRVPANDFLLTILNEINIPIIGTSANISGTSPSFNFSEVQMNLSSKQVDLWIDHGILPRSLPSTLVDFTNPNNPKILREGDFDFIASYNELYE